MRHKPECLRIPRKTPWSNEKLLYFWDLTIWMPVVPKLWLLRKKFNWIFTKFLTWWEVWKITTREERQGLYEERPACEHFFIPPFIIKDQLITVLQSEAGLWMWLWEAMWSQESGFILFSSFLIWRDVCCDCSVMRDVWLRHSWYGRNTGFLQCLF